MSRKPSLKTIRSAPAARVFCPSESNLSDTQGKIILLLEEWEALRLVDYMRLEQTVAALSMAISRQTVQMLLSSARTKLARAIVEGLPLRIQDNPKNTSKQHTPFMKRNTQMKIAVTTQHNQVFPHFGRTPEFSIVTAEDGKIVEENIIPAPAEGHGALIGFLVDQGVDVLICGGVGGGAVNSLRASGIQVYAGASGPVKEQVLSLLSGQLPQQGDADCDHHGEHDHEHHHEHGHEGGDCGHHQG
ncbi:MAG: NifB/NifX family molybdenum-iron cluster-binding protein [Anaerolineaceae bacterium]